MKRFVSILLACIVLCQASEAVERGDSLSCPPKLRFVPAVTDAAIAFGLNAGVTELLKNSVYELRPDKSDFASFPSRHSSYVFNIASIVSHELYRYSPFWLSVSQTAANAVAMQRVYKSKHFPSDVLAGAATGIATTEIARAIGRKIFPSKSHCYFDADNLSSLNASTTALIPLEKRGEGLSVGCGIESLLGISLAQSGWWGYGVSLRLRSQPIYLDDIYLDAMNSAVIAVESYITRSVFDGQWSLGAYAAAGPVRNFKRPMRCAASWSGLLDCSAALSRQVSKNLSIGGELGCDVTDRPGSKTNLKIALLTKAQF